MCKYYRSVKVEGIEFGGCAGVDYMQTECSGDPAACRYQEEIEEARIEREISRV